MDVDWQAIGWLLADTLTKPIFILDRSGTIRLVNEAAERATGWWRREVVGLHGSDVLVPARHAGGGGRWVSDALRGIVKTASFRAESGQGVQLEVNVEISAMGDGDSKALLLIASRVAVAETEDTSPKNLRYRIATSPERFGALESLTTESHTSYLNGTTGPCFSYIYGLDSPCGDCPALRGSGGAWPRISVRPHVSRPDLYELVHANLEEHDTVQVDIRRISDEELSRLFSAKLRRVAVESSLTSRELDVLEHLMIGRGPEEIAKLLDVSQRTVKFHQTNILDKLGAESRNDILRVLL